jgi:O-antigen ligase
MHHPDSTKTWPVTLIQLRGPRRVRGKLFHSTIADKWRRASDDSRREVLNYVIAERPEERRDPHRIAFGLLYLFTLLLYVRPNDLFPAIGTFPLAKIVAILAPVAFVYAQHSLSKPIINWTVEVKMACALLLLAFLFTPIAASPKDSVTALNEIFIKTVAIFILMTSLINTRKRLRAIISLTVICGTWLAIHAVGSYASSNFTMDGTRIEGIVGGIFSNPNDLALALNMLIPLAATLALTSVGRKRLLYSACALIMTAGVIVTFSRGGFLTLVALSAVMVWKFGRGQRVKALIAIMLPSVILIAAVFDTYQNRLISIFDHKKDQSGSAQERTELLKHGLALAVQRPFIGVGIGNYHIYSIREKVAHNAYLETAVELGTLGLIAYLTMILAPLRGLARIERETLKARSPNDLEMKYLSVGLQTVLVAYLVNSFFLSVQYLWYVYYAAAYAVALREIYAAERAASAKRDQATAPQDRMEDVSYSIGTLWKSAPRRHAGSLWPEYRFRKGYR